jgi:predicted O-methyltransferase YrrM
VTPGDAWYEPIVAGPSTFAEECSHADTVKAVAGVMSILEQDDYCRFLADYYNIGLRRFGDKWKYADILTVLYAISRNITVESYMEIGVRRGRSMAVVASANAESTIVGFDMWLENYAGIENPGPDFVASELKKVGYKGELKLISGNSRRTVPEYFKANPHAYFDVITVDGDHSASGAVADLKNVIPRLKIGGALVFDDICNVSHPALRHVWDKLVVKSKRFMTYTFDELGFGVSFAIKRY